jgi:hypothetical protein
MGMLNLSARASSVLAALCAVLNIKPGKWAPAEQPCARNL